MTAPPTTLRLADEHPACRVLGPGTRYAIWVQGCPLSCPDCISPQWIPERGGREVDVEVLADRIAEHARDGLTISGGEPMAQAAALVRLVRAVRVRRDLSVMSYTGYPLSWLRRRGDPGQTALLGELDLLVDGPYVRNRHASLRWRGSANQRVRALTARHVDDLAAPDTTDGLQFEIGAGGDRLEWLGVPPVPGFRRDLEAALALRPHREEPRDP